MTADPLPAVSRVRKARWESVVSCGHYVRVGNVIVKRSGKWMCLPCAVAAIRASSVPVTTAPERTP